VARRTASRPSEGATHILNTLGSPEASQLLGGPSHSRDRGGTTSASNSSADYPMETPATGDAPQLVLTGVIELQTRTRDEVLHGL
jgi:hypothetical protein